MSPSWRDEEFEEIEASAIELQDYVRGVIADSGRRMRDDFLSRYLKAVREAGTLSPIEEIMQLMLIILAGSDTTRTAMVMVTALVLQNPALWSSLTGNQSYVAAAVEEGLRSEPPVGSFRGWPSRISIWMDTCCQREASSRSVSCLACETKNTTRTLIFLMLGVNKCVGTSGLAREFIVASARRWLGLNCKKDLEHFCAARRILRW